jgi:D-alanine-D-alanine ligase-like ATP-grasp enzyme
VIAPEIDVVRTLGADRWLRRRLAGGGDEVRLARSHEEAYRAIWEGAASAAGAEVRELGDGFLMISRERAETLVRRHLVMINDPATTALALDKSLVHRLLAAEGLPVPEYLEVDRHDRAGALAFLGRQRPCVVKPAGGTSGGTGVTCGVESAEDLSRARLAAARWDRRLLIERQSSGEEYRLLFLDGQLIDAVRRGRPCVTGNGISTVLELIEAENRRRLDAGSRDVSRRIHVDLDCELAVRRSGLSLRSVPAQGQLVYVKSAVSENAATDNVTASDLSPGLVSEAARAVELLRLSLAGIDLVTPDPKLALSEAHGTILEVNATPGFHYHYQVAGGDQATSVAIPILERLLRAAAG